MWRAAGSRPLHRLSDVLDLMSRHTDSDGSCPGGALRPGRLTAERRTCWILSLLYLSKFDTFQREFVSRTNETTESFYHCKHDEEEERCSDPERRETGTDAGVCPPS